MLVIFSEGRFGNQIFQLSGALSARVANEAVLLIGFADLPKKWRQQRVFVFRKRHSRSAFGRFFSNRSARFVRFLARCRLLSGLRADTRNRVLVRKNGLFRLITVGLDRWMQIGDFADPRWAVGVYSSLVVENPRWVDRRETVFLHVRRTDYLAFPTVEHPAALPASFFEAGANLLKQTFPGAVVQIFSDDLAWCAAQRFSEGAELLDVSAQEAWVRMCDARGGVVSPSSFSFWAAKVSGAKSSSESVFVAPTYWYGWGEKRWRPKLIFSNQFLYVDVVEDSRSLLPPKHADKSR